MTLEDLAFPPRAADVLAVTAGMIRTPHAPVEKPEITLVLPYPPSANRRGDLPVADLDASFTVRLCA